MYNGCHTSVCPGKCNLFRVYLRPDPSLALPKGHTLQIIRPLYVLSDAGDVWWSTIRESLTSSLYFRQTSGYPFLMYADSAAKPSLLVFYVDYILFAGTPSMVRSCDAIAQRFPSKSGQSPPLTFSRSEIERTSDGSIVHQRSDAQSLSPLPSIASFDDFHRLGHQLACLATTRPNLPAAVNIMLQTTAKTYTPKDLALINFIQQRASASPTMGLTFDSLDSATLYLVVYINASFAINADGTSPLVYPVLFIYGTGRTSVQHFSNRKAKSVARSVLDAELLAFADAVYVAVMILHDLTAIL